MPAEKYLFAALGRTLVSEPDILLLDEPTNHLDIDSIVWLEEFLLRYVKTLLFVTHDRAFLRALATRIVEIDRGTLLIVSHDREFLNNVVTSTLVFESDASGEYTINEYVGGYDDWLRQRRTPEPPSAKPAPKATPTALPVARPRKLTFKEQRELEGLPSRIEALEAEQHALAEQMADPTFYQGDGSATVPTTARLAEIENELATAFTRWEELLELEKSALVGQSTAYTK